MKRPIVLIILLALFFLFCRLSHATTLDFPGNIDATYDQRVTAKEYAADNNTGRQQVHIEQGFTDMRIKNHIMGYVGYSLYAPNEVATDNHIQVGFRNQSLLPPFTLKLEYQTPFHQAVDTSNTVVFSINYNRDWNLIKGHKENKDE